MRVAVALVFLVGSTTTVPTQAGSPGEPVDLTEHGLQCASKQAAACQLIAGPAATRLAQMLKAAGEGTEAALADAVEIAMAVPPEKSNRAARLLRLIKEYYGAFDQFLVRQTSAEAATVLLRNSYAQYWFEVKMATSADSRGKISAWDIGRVPSPTEVISKTVNRATFASELDAYLAHLVEVERFSGVGLVIDAQGTIFSKAYGSANREREQANLIDTRFNVGSVTKAITSAVIFQLVEQGRVSLDARIGQYLPDYPVEAVRETVTVRHLLSHRSGLGDYFEFGYDEVKDGLSEISDYMGLFAEEDFPTTEPGAEYSYSNSGFVVLGAIIEAVTDQDYFSVVSDTVYQPLGMNASGHDFAKALPANTAVGYTSDEDGDGSLVRNTNHVARRGSSAGGSKSSAGDLYRFARALHQGELVSQSTFEEMAAPSSGREGSDGGSEYGLGLVNEYEYGKRWIGHLGGGPGVSASVLLEPKSGAIMIFLSNLDWGTLMASRKTMELFERLGETSIN